MTCHSCSSITLPKGCKNNGLCGVSGCNKLNVVDWLWDVKPPSLENVFQGVEVRFKNARKEFYRNDREISLSIGDVVVVEAKEGYDIGVVSITGDLVKRQMKKKHGMIAAGQLPSIIRKASNTDIEKWEKHRCREADIMLKSRKLAMDQKLGMKISDVEYQGDTKKITFYYTADERIDFRDLVKELASAFKAKIEMKQIGMRQEAGMIGGIGSCGRELCCSTWLTDFKSVSTSAARYQQLALNPDKLAGQCGKLKCCLNYELDAYMEELKVFPSTNKKLKTKKGNAVFQKMDIFKKTMTYSYIEEAGSFIVLSLERVLEILEVNSTGEKVDELVSSSVVEIQSNDWGDVVGQDSLTRFDRSGNRKKKRKFKKNRKKRHDKNS